MTLFHVVRKSERQPTTRGPKAFLLEDAWDDWGKFRTQFLLIVIDEAGSEHSIGQVKIGQVGLLPARVIEPNHRAPDLPRSFDSLDGNFFSVGQGEDYYQALNELSEELKISVLEGLRDCAFDLNIFNAHFGELVMSESLLRSVSGASVRTRLNRLTHGDAVLTEFRFKYFIPNPGANPPAALSFVVEPGAQPPTNVHVLIGRNGVGKSRCMRHMILSLLGRRAPLDENYGSIHLEHDVFSEWSFAGLVLVSFSAFDDFDVVPEAADQMPCTVVGLRKPVPSGGPSQTKSKPELAADFRLSLEKCLVGQKAKRWLAAIKTLEADDLFQDAEIPLLAEGPQDANWSTRAEKLFELLSSGHSIVLLTITKLVELVDEKTLVFLDEPEGHLHPPLLSAFIRCLSDLLGKRNGMAIVATHSPVVLQEVPRTCAWKLKRSGLTGLVERPALETFGANIGVLTRDVFGLEVTRAGFHTVLAAAVDGGQSFDAVIERFGAQLGDEARAIVQALIIDRDRPTYETTDDPTL